MGRPRAFDWDAAERLYAQHRSYTVVGQMLGVSGHAVRYALQPKVREYHQRYQREKRPSDGPCVDCGGIASAGRYREGARCRDCSAKVLATGVRETALCCHRCREWKPDEDFTRKPTAPKLRRGRDSECKSCQSARKRQRRARQRVAA